MLKAYTIQMILVYNHQYNGFGEETITAIEAMNNIDNNYENKSISNGKIKRYFERIRIKFPNIIDEIRGSEKFSLYIGKPINEIIENIVTQFMPIKTYR